MKTTNLFVFSLLFYCSTSAQSKWGLEQYNYIYQSGPAVFVPSVQLETKNNWYAEVRYNYESLNTVSLLGGKGFSGGREIEYTITPLIGISAGEFAGITLAANVDAEWRNFYLSIESQYSRSWNNKEANFFFNWSELEYSVTKNWFTGFAIQGGLEAGSTYIEPGIFTGLRFNNISVPFYSFNPFKRDRYFVLALNIEYSTKKK